MRPVLHCFATFLDPFGRFGPILVVTLESAAWLKSQGWFIVGPDPEDEEALARVLRPAGGAKTKKTALAARVSGLPATAGTDNAPAAPRRAAPAFSLQFASDPGVTPQSVSLAVDHRTGWTHNDGSLLAPDEVVIAVKANHLARNTGLGGSLLWDPAIVDWSGWVEGEFLKQEGSPVQWSFSPTTGRITFGLSLPSTGGSVTGDGALIYLFFKRHAHTFGGSTRLQWDSPCLGQQGGDIIRESRSDVGANFFGGCLTVSGH